jgi:catechol 2,3-dioxygenase-like lactoylglutathione lyase family enzyme
MAADAEQVLFRRYGGRRGEPDCRNQAFFPGDDPLPPAVVVQTRTARTENEQSRCVERPTKLWFDGVEVIGIDHVQLAMPAGGEDAAREFYARVLGIPEVRKPPALAGRGGAWFETGGLKLHVGVDPDFRPARKAHAGLLVRELPVLVRRLRHAGYEVEEVRDDRLHAYVSDPFGNRLELVETAS